jgi:uncharacterized protein (TIGR00725 family)
MTTVRQKLLIGVVGSGTASPAGLAAAQRVGQLLAENGAVLVCGGLGGIMEAASRGCAEAGGEVIGILPGAAANSANPFVTLPVVTNMGHARNVIIAHTAQALIALEGEYGTIAEMAIGLKLGKKVIQLLALTELPGTLLVRTPEEAVEQALSAVKEGSG